MKSTVMILWVALTLNAGMFALEFWQGLVAASSALLADSLDMLADALVFALTLAALRAGSMQQARAALAKGYLMAGLGVLVLAQAIYSAASGAMPRPEVMGWVAALALACNVICYLLLAPRRQASLSLAACWVCARNDLFANTAVLVAAALVAATGSALPDLLVGLLITALFLGSARGVIREARSALAAGSARGIARTRLSPSSVQSATAAHGTSAAGSSTAGVAAPRRGLLVAR